MIPKRKRCRVGKRSPTGVVPRSCGGGLKRPFAEQVAFFRDKQGPLLPTATWRDPWKSQHDRAFKVAGAARPTGWPSGLLPAEYAATQGVVDEATNKALDGKSVIYIREVPQGGGYVLVVKATQTGEGLWVTSYRQLSSKEAAKDTEIRRLLKKEEK